MGEITYMLPGYSDFDQHYTTASQVRSIARYELFEAAKRIDIYDPVWGECSIGQWPGDEIFTELFLNPLVQRSVGIEQLTLPRHFATMPGSTEMPRSEHVWGSLVLTRKLIEKARQEGQVFDDREVLLMEQRTLVSDLGHTAFSHLGDWLFQGYGGSEDQHDIELMQMLEEGGVLEILDRHKLDPAEVVFPDISDWIECPQPDLCIDRVDYGAREMSRWLTGMQPAAEWLDNFSLKDDAIVMKNQKLAKRFGVDFALLATEHWGHPVHRLQLQLFGELVRSVISGGDLAMAGYDMNHPRDLLYAVDDDVLSATRQIGTINHDLHAVMLDIARAQRKIFAHGREAELQRFRSRVENRWEEVDETLHFPHPLEARNWTTEYTGVVPNNLEFIPASSADEVEDFGGLPHTLDVFLPALKPRQVDPLFFDDESNVVSLSEVDDQYAGFLAEQKAIQSQGYVSRIHAAPQFLDQLKEKLRVVETDWQAALQHERATPARRERLFADMGHYALSRRQVDMRLY